MERFGIGVQPEFENNVSVSARRLEGLLNFFFLEKVLSTGLVRFYSSHKRAARDITALFRDITDPIVEF